MLGVLESTRRVVDAARQVTIDADAQRGIPARASLAQPSRFLSDRAEAERAFALGAPVVALAAAAATSALSLGLRVGFLHRRPAREVG